MKIAKLTLLVLSALAVSFSVYLHVSAVATDSWERTDGTVLESGFQGYESASDGATGTTSRIEPRVRYTYFVYGKKYVGKDIKVFDVAFNSTYSAKLAYREFAIGEIVTVYYDPVNPASSLLDRAYPIVSVVAFSLLGLSGSVVALSLRRIVDALRQWILSLG